MCNYVYIFFCVILCKFVYNYIKHLNDKIDLMANTQPRASVTFRKDINEKLDAECERTKLSKNKLISKIIEDYFNNLQSDHEEKIQSMTDDERKMLHKHEEDMEELKHEIKEIKNILSGIVPRRKD